MNDAPGSTLHIDVPPTIAVDTGSLWTGILARRGSDALNGALVGLHPRRVLSDAERGRLELDDLDMWHSYYERVYAAVDAMWDRVFAAAEPLVVVEAVTVPRRPNPRTNRRIPLADWLPARELVVGLCARYPGAAVVEGDGFGVRHQKARGGSGDWRDYYPQELYRRRPEGWMPSDHPESLRNHERAAFDAAGVAHLALQRTAA